MVGLIDIPQRRWRGLVKYMQAFADGEDTTYEDMPADVPVPRFLKLAADDLKAFYFEARMCQRPDQQNNDLQNWFWTETAAGDLLTKVAERLNESGDERAALGIARSRYDPRPRVGGRGLRAAMKKTVLNIVAAPSVQNASLYVPVTSNRTPA